MQLHLHKQNRQPVTAQLAVSICQKPNADAVETCQKKLLNSYYNVFSGTSTPIVPEIFFIGSVQIS